MSQSRHSNGSASAGPSRLPTYVASAPRKSASSSASQAVNGISTPRRSNGPRKSSAFEVFDAPAYCNNMAAFIAEQLSSRSPKARRQDSAVGETSHDGWRGGDPRPLAIPSTPSRLADVSVQTVVGDDDAEVSEGFEEDQGDEEDDEEDDDEDEDEGEDEDEDEDEDDIDFARTRKTREAAQAFLQQVQGQSANLTEAERSLEEQALALFGTAADGREEAITTDDAAESEIQPEVAAQIAVMLAEEKKSSGRPLIEVMNESASEDDSDDRDEDEEGEGGDSIGEESEDGEGFSDADEDEKAEDEEELVEDAQAVPMQVPKGSFEMDELEDNDDEQDGSAAEDVYLDGSMEDEEEEVEDDDEGEAGNDERDLDIYTNGGNLYADAPHTSTPDEPIELLDSSDEEAEDVGEEEPAGYAEEQGEIDQAYQGENDALPQPEPSMVEGVPVSANIFEQTDIPLDPSAWMSSLVGGELSNEQQDVEQTADLLSDALTASQAEPLSAAADDGRSRLEANATSPPVDVPPPARDLQQNMSSGTQLLSLKNHIDVALPDASRPASVTVQPGTPQRANSPPGTIPSPAQDLQQGMTSGAQLLSLKKHIDIALPDASKPPSLAVQPGTPQRATSVELVRRAGDGTARHARDLFDIKNIVSDAVGGTPSLGTSLLSDVDTVPRGTDEGHGDGADEVRSLINNEAAAEPAEPAGLAVSNVDEADLPAQADNGPTDFYELGEHAQEDRTAGVSGHDDEKRGSEALHPGASIDEEPREDQVEDELIDYEEAQGVDEEALAEEGEPVKAEEAGNGDDEAEKDELNTEVPFDEDDVVAQTEQPATETGKPVEHVFETGQAHEDAQPSTKGKDEGEATKPLPRRSTRARTTSTQDASISPVITKRSLRSATPRATSEAPSETSRSAKKKRRSPRKSDAAGDLADFVPDEIREEEEDDSAEGRQAKRARTEEKQEDPSVQFKDEGEEEAEVFDTSILEEEEEPMEVDNMVEEEKPHEEEAHSGGEEGDEEKTEMKKRKRSPRKSGPRKSADPTFRVTKVEESSSEEDEEAVEKKQKKEEAAKAKKEADREKRRILREAKKQEKEEEQKEAKEAERAAAGVVRSKRRTSEDAKTFRPDKEADEGDREDDEETNASRKTRPRRSRRKASQTPGQE